MKNKQIKLLVERYPVLKAIENEVFNAYQILENCYAHGGKLLVAGNGGSAADAEHIVGELMKGFKLPRKPDTDFAEKLVAENQELGSILAENLQGALPAIALDGHPALSTAYMNDCEPLLCFAQQVNGYGKTGDVFLGISTSGNSKNVLYAATTAHAKGMKVIGLTGAKSGKLEQMSDICIKVPQIETYMIQELHLPVYHCLCLMLEERFLGRTVEMEKQALLNTYINNVTMPETIAAIEKMIADNKKSYVVAINVDVVMKIENDPYLKQVVDNADMVLVDGKPLVWISKLHGKPLKAKISGSDLVPLLCDVAAKKGYSIFIIGGKDGIAEQAKRKLEEKLPGIQIVGTYAPPLGFEKDEKELDKINQMISGVHPDLLIACFGCPKQEKWIYENISKYDAKVSVCAGATVDFLAGNVNRAPRWMSEHGLEWFYRFLQEPKRMFKRYFVDDVKIVGLIKKYR